eukprot:CAMPEP_0180512854 /NCGR_PEP_ID=MMETSP1036_2-20121128/51820_1 /TAXON_ID=632150 /ORGANISM="Azadinium spinosum, Strain 3D9" /LENGTH=131 /DNA_ID=CAMNT_0022524041 /DNA_START=86 /DNA_END=478 /DNA_ORIENTATION=+
MYNEDRVTHAHMEEMFTRHGYTSDSFIGFSFDDMAPIDVGFNAISSAFLGINMLQISPSTVCILEGQSKVGQKLEAHGFEVLYVDMPYSRDFSGAHHCVTCPLHRQCPPPTVHKAAPTQGKVSGGEPAVFG